MRAFRELPLRFRPQTMTPSCQLDRISDWFGRSCQVPVMLCCCLGLRTTASTTMEVVITFCCAFFPHLDTSGRINMHIYHTTDPCASANSFPSHPQTLFFSLPFAEFVLTAAWFGLVWLGQFPPVSVIFTLTHAPPDGPTARSLAYIRHLVQATAMLAVVKTPEKLWYSCLWLSFRLGPIVCLRRKALSETIHKRPLHAQTLPTGFGRHFVGFPSPRCFAFPVWEVPQPVFRCALVKTSYPRACIPTGLLSCMTGPTAVLLCSTDLLPRATLATNCSMSWQPQTAAYLWAEKVSMIHRHWPVNLVSRAFLSFPKTAV
ncbi:unnamed protein product [Protopolystoma xenopodis]|uniref:Uncharacterized protein n=1 Tax=Protopolystoma xenopodis TaxID=117903 RepID=A0A3S5B661_9PLAT|nr:unnamed protein product [Protopolystoma xenopodis]